MLSQRETNSFKEDISVKSPEELHSMREEVFSQLESLEVTRDGN